MGRGIINTMDCSRHMTCICYTVYIDTIPVSVMYSKEYEINSTANSRHDNILTHAEQDKQAVGLTV